MSGPFPGFQATEPFICPSNGAALQTGALPMPLIPSLASFHYTVNPISDTDIQILRIRALAVSHRRVNSCIVTCAFLTIEAMIHKISRRARGNALAASHPKDFNFLINLLEVSFLTLDDGHCPPDGLAGAGPVHLVTAGHGRCNVEVRSS
jgi:hypothetical protein